MLHARPEPLGPRRRSCCRPRMTYVMVRLTRKASARAWFHHRSQLTTASLLRFIAPPSHGPQALRPSSPNLLPRRLIFVTLLLTRKASARACRVGTRHMANWTADSWAFCCAVAALCIWSIGSSACLGQTSNGPFQDSRHEPNMAHVRSSCHHPAHSEHICMVICFHQETVYRIVTLSHHKF